MKYMVVTTNVSNCTIMMARTLHIIHHCIFTNMDHIYTYLYKETEAYWHICKCIKISTMHHKYEYEENKHIVGIRDDKDTVNWACIMRTCASTMHTHTRVRTCTCTYVTLLHSTRYRACDLLIHDGIKFTHVGKRCHWSSKRYSKHWSLENVFNPLQDKTRIYICCLTFFMPKHGYIYLCLLTHWGRVTHICVGNLTIIGSDNGLSPGRRQAIIWTNAGILLIRPLGTNFSEFLVEILIVSFKKMRLKVSSAKWRLFRLGLNVLTLFMPKHGYISLLVNSLHDESRI